MKNNSDILSLEELLNQKEKPNFLKTSGKITANFLNEPKQKVEKLVKVNPVIEKTQKVDQNKAKEIKQTQQHLENFKSYIELQKFAQKVSKNSELEQQSKKISKKKQQSSIKEKEKQRRMKGQSSISTWKSESEMKLRQQFD